MKFFIDTANLEQIREANALGVLDGVTTNPSLMAKEGIKVPVGEEFDSLAEAKISINNYIEKPIVIKPKSTNLKTNVPKSTNLYNQKQLNLNL